MTGYKVFNSDWTCRGFQYEVGKTYETEEEPICCRRGFHFCDKLVNCFNYYNFDSNNKVAIVEILGDVDISGDKSCTNKLHILKELTWYEVLEMVNTGNRNTGNRNTGDYNTGNYNTGNRNTGNYNTGDCNTGNRNTGNYNTGDCNTGNRNTGYYNTGNYNTGNRNTGNYNTGNYNTGNYNAGNYNTGDCNTGNRNTGYYNTGNYNTGNRNTGNYNTGYYNTGNYNAGNYNTGNYNTGNYNTGCFNTLNSNMTFFNQLSNWTYSDWNRSKAKAILDTMPMNTLKWIGLDSMTYIEKEFNPEYETTGGYLKMFKATKEDKQTWWDNLSDKYKEEVLSLPNFDATIFEAITGINVNLK